MAYVIQEIAEPSMFYPSRYLSEAKRYQKKTNADKVISQYNTSAYLVIEEDKIGSLEHKKIFLEKRIIQEIKKDSAHRKKYSDLNFPQLTDSEFQELAEQVWNNFVTENLTI